MWLLCLIWNWTLRFQSSQASCWPSWTCKPFSSSVCTITSPCGSFIVVHNNGLTVFFTIVVCLCLVLSMFVSGFVFYRLVWSYECIASDITRSRLLECSMTHYAMQDSMLGLKIVMSNFTVLYHAASDIDLTCLKNGWISKRLSKLSGFLMGG